MERESVSLYSKPTSADDGTPLLRLHEVTAYYTHEDRTVLQSVSLTVRDGEIVALLGPNGAGKSTLLRAVTGRARVSGGSIELRGERITGLRPEQACRRGIVYVPEGQRVWARMTVEENIRLGAFVTRDRKRIARAMAAAFEGFPALWPLRGRRASELSGGQRQMVTLARALMASPSLLLLDEPSLGLSPQMMDDLFELIPRITRDRGIACLLVEQNAREALQVSDRACVLALGAVALEGAAAELDWQRDLEPIYFGTSPAPAAS